MKELYERINAEHIAEAVELSGILSIYSTLNELQQNQNQIGIANLNRWCHFFNENITEPPCIYEAMIEACSQAAGESELFNSLTGHEFGLSTEFFNILFEEKTQLILKNPLAANKFLHISLIFGKYPGMVIRSLRKYAIKLNHAVSVGEIEDLFKWLFVKYEAPSVLIAHLEFLTEKEIEYLMYLLRGERPNKWPNSPIALTKKESFLLFHSELQFNQFEDNILLRAMICCRLFRNNESSIHYLITFLRYSSLFQNDISNFAGSLNFWKRAYDFICSIDFNEVNLSIEEFIDYFDFINRTQGDAYSFKGRTPKSIENHIHNWHVRAEFDKLDIFMEDRWSSMGIRKKEITFNDAQYLFYELISGKLLKRESKRMSHCVFSYAPMCSNGLCHIFSMEKKYDDGNYPQLTIEVRNKSIVQVLGFRNRSATEEELNVIVHWAKKVGLNSDQVKPQKRKILE